MIKFKGARGTTGSTFEIMFRHDFILFLATEPLPGLFTYQMLHDFPRGAWQSLGSIFQAKSLHERLYRLPLLWDRVYNARAFVHVSAREGVLQRSQRTLIFE